MYYTFSHYDKAPLVWLSMVEYWRATNHPLYTLLQENLDTTDEYQAVENFHSLLRAHTNKWDTADDISAEKPGRLRTTSINFDILQATSSPPPPPPRRAMMSHSQLRRLKLKSAFYLLHKIQAICANPFAAQEQPRLPWRRKKVSRWILLDLFRQLAIQNFLLAVRLPMVRERRHHQASANNRASTSICTTAAAVMRSRQLPKRR